MTVLTPTLLAVASVSHGSLGLELDILRRMTPERKLAVMHALIRQAYMLKDAAVRAASPELPDAEVAKRVRESIGGNRP